MQKASRHRVQRPKSVPSVRSKAQSVSLLPTSAELPPVQSAESYDAVPVGCMTLSRMGIIEQVNLTAVQLLGRLRPQLLNQPLVALITRRDRKKFQNFLAQLRRRPARAVLQVALDRKKDDAMVIELVVAPSVAPGNERMRFQCALLDVTGRRRVESELRASEEKFRTLASHAPVGIFLADQNGGITYVNETWRLLTAFSDERARGKGWLQTVHYDDRARVVAVWDESIRKHAPFNAEFRFLQPSGKAVWVQSKAVSLKNAAGEFVGYIGTIADITERKLAEEASQRLAAIVESSDDAIISKDLNGIITSWNRGAQRIFGYTAGEMVGKSILKLIPPERHPEEDEILKHIRQGLSVDHFETVRRHKDGRLLDMSLTISPVRNARGEIIGASKIARDISARIQAERELQQAHAKVLAASRAKDDFLAMLSHELRTPLNPVLLLASEWARVPDLPPRVRADFAAIRKNIELEARLIDDMLDITRLSRGKLLLNLEVVDANVVLRDAIATVRGDVEQKKITLVSNLHALRPTVQGDPVRLQQIFWNVLKNAVKFTPEGGVISVETEMTDARITVKIHDTGIGMDADETTRIFEAFSQGAHSGFGGLGLGLAISRKLIELHHGSIRAVSEGRGRGATFIIELPVIRQAKKAAVAEKVPAGQLPLPLPEKSSHGVRVLLVEDHEPTRNALVQLLERRSFKVQAAGSLAEARRLADAQGFQLLISDIGLPDGSGYELMEEFRKNHSAIGIALTGYGTEQDVTRSHAAGFVTHLTKPVRVESLDTALATALAKA